MTLSKTLLAAVSVASLAGAASAEPVRNVVLVHGAFADGSGWKPVAEILQADGYTVSVVQQPMTSVADDVAATNRILDGQSGPAVLVGHSYGGAVITEAGNHANVASLVYVAAFAPAEGDVLGAMSEGTPPASHSITATSDGFLLVDPAQFPADFAADVPAATAEFMAISQIPMNGQIWGTPIGAPAWQYKPSFAVLTTSDRMINPDLQRSMYARAGSDVTEIDASHSVFLSHPQDVADVIEAAAVAAGL
ncbi:alpha/beta fold hydrolase [Pseudooceanicola spongiae]|nr:alpha/beta hydrolase [Pseudooceanicola spongiae]